MYQNILNKEAKVALIGLGYVGLPIALEFAKKVSVIGFDINADRVEMMKNHVDPSQELTAEDFENTDILFTADPKDLADATFYIVAVPTPVDAHKVPNLKPVISASKTIGKYLKKGDCVVYESTVYPGCTEEDCLPVLEQNSGLSLANGDFMIGFSPERINPGDKEHTISNIIKVISGNNDEALDLIAKVYELVVKPGVHRASSIKVAEAAKIIENTQRDVNIALMNELSKIFEKLDINTYDVLQAAGTKWNFLNFYPGLVGGHCIGVDPYYLTYKAISLGYKPEVILSGRRINDSMGSYVAKRLVQLLIKTGKKINTAKVLVMGATFKENVSDIRNSKVIDVVNELRAFMLNVDIIDPLTEAAEMEREYGLSLTENLADEYDAVIMAVNHDEYMNYSEADFKKMMDNQGILVDIKGIYRDKIKDLTYWSL